MKTTCHSSAVIAFQFLLSIHLGFGLWPVRGEQSLPTEAVADDPVAAQKAIAALRAKGPAGLDALFDAHAAEIDERLARPPEMVSDSPEWRRLCAALDAVAQQHDDFASHLFWYTDLAAAEAAAKTSGKPILSLRLLGRLDEDFSCANSRLFRTVLYANAEVSQYLRDHFILHWESERPAPKITIDFGDGRRLERTITGNSIHYVLDPEGRVVDAVPGLYGPQAFLAALKPAAELAGAGSPGSARSRDESLREYHRQRLTAELTQWNLEVTNVAGAGWLNLGGAATGARPAAAAADLRAVSKSVIELPLLRAVGATRDSLAKSSDAQTWGRLAELHLEDALLDARTVALMQIKSPAIKKAADVVKCSAGGPLTEMVAKLQRTLAEDGVRNEYLLHSAIHEWFVDGSAPANLPALNEKVYAELFLTPRNDPWLGLKADNIYSALDRDGAEAGQ